uniref:23S rRNA (uracil(1939)-C(5))-methyltransferase RlmD n=1 Tax=Agathobacter sp. TaxID=2021311 RepID=UPI0040577A79
MTERIGNEKMIKKSKKNRTVEKRNDKKNGKKSGEKADFIRNEQNKTTDDKCPYAKKCGGCDYQGMEYAKQLEKKEAEVKRLLKPFVKISPIVGMDNPYHYRHKVHAVFDCVGRGQVVAGVYKKNSHDVVDIEQCRIENEEAGAIIRDIKGLLRSFKIKTYDEDTGYGLLRHVLVRKGYHTGEIMVVLVLGSPILPSKNNFIKALRKNHPDITTVVINVNDKKTSMVLGERNIVVYGKGFIEDKLCGCTFRISPNSFYQVNPVQTELLYEKAISCAKLTGKERVIDAYCGTGTIGIIAAKTAKEVLGVELNKDAIKDAITNAKRNDVKNIRFIHDDAGKYMVTMAERKEKADVVIMDPPRSGSDEAFLSAMVKLSPERIVYVSCNPETLARDLMYLTKKGYKVAEAIPYDMFPFTYHVETCVLLSKLKSTSRIEVEVSLDELELSKAESKATYEEIKAYVLEHTGLKVSQLYVAQVKRKYGLIERINYNVGEGKARVPQVTPEKEKAIEDALRHFQMIE